MLRKRYRYWSKDYEIEPTLAEITEAKALGVGVITMLCERRLAEFLDGLVEEKGDIALSVDQRIRDDENGKYLEIKATSLFFGNRRRVITGMHIRLLTRLRVAAQMISHRRFIKW